MTPDIIPLESIHIAAPCRADWNAMQRVQGSDCTRFCPGCGQNVYDVSGLTRDEANRLIAAREGHVCLRLHRRQDGTIITRDCPVGKAAAHKRKYGTQMLAAVIWMAAAMGAVGSLLVNRLLANPGLNPVNNAALASHTADAPEPTPLPLVAPPPAPELPPPPIEQCPAPTTPPASSDESQVTVSMGAPLPPPAESTGIAPDTH